MNVSCLLKPGTETCNQFANDFPILSTKINGKPLAYLDNAATTQRPRSVIEAMNRYYRTANANPHRGVYDLAVRSTEVYESARKKIATFVGAADPAEVIFTRNATEALNMIARCAARPILRKGDEILLPISEHHSNLIPWQQVAAETGASLIYLRLDASGKITNEEIAKKLGPKTRVVTFAPVSNVLGNIVQTEALIAAAHQYGALVVLDCAQTMLHQYVDFTKIGADFAAFSAHKMLGPMGVGVLWGRRKLLEAMPPFLTGGDMIEYVSETEASFAPPPVRFEAGTQNPAGAAGLAAAIEYIEGIGFDVIAKQETALTRYALDILTHLPGVRIPGDTRPENAENRCGVISFIMEGIHPHDLASILDSDGVAVRAGHQCAQPLMHDLGVGSVTRVSLCFYNTEKDIDALAEGIRHAWRIFGHEH